MPPALVIAGLGGLGLAGMLDQNIQNKAAIKNAQNAQTAGQGQVQANQAAAQNALANRVAQQPGPAQPGNAPSAPAYSGANVPMVQPAQPPGSIPPQVLALLAKMQPGAA